MPSLHLVGHAVAVLALCLAVVFVYRPSLRHGPRADHWGFVSATMHEHTFAGLVARTYSYNRQGESPGDYPLFRPLLFVLLSAETALFGHHYSWWQGVGICLHLVAVLLFLRLLLRLRGCFAPSNRLLLIAAYVFTCFFALDFALVEMVIWTHINGYLLHLISSLLALLLLLEEVITPTASAKGRIALAFVLLLLAAFTHEMGQFFAVLVGLVLAGAALKAGLRRAAVVRAVLFASILLVYQLANQLDQRAHPQAWVDIDTASIAEHFTVQASVEHALRYLMFTLFQPFFPSLVDWAFQGRVCLWEPVFSAGRYFDLGPVSLISYAVFTCLLFLAARSLAHSRHVRGVESVWLLGALFLGLLALHLGMTVLGRMNIRPGVKVLAHNPYYCYLPLMLFLLTVYLLLAATASRMANGRLLAATLLGMMVLTPQSAAVVLEMNSHIRHEMYPLRSKLNALVKLVRQHAHEPDFRLSFSPEWLDALYQKHRDVAFPLAVYRHLIDHDNPTHVLVLEKGKTAVLNAAEYRQRHPDQPTTVLPYLERAFQQEYVYSCRGRYYLVFSWDVYYRADLRDYAYCLEGDTLEAVLEQLPSLRRRVADDLRTGRLVPVGVAIRPLEWREYGLELYQAGGRYYAIPEGEGPLTQQGLVRGRYSRWYTAESLPELFARFKKPLRDGVSRFSR